MRRIVNFRPPLFCAIGLVLGILSFYEFLFGNFWFGIISAAIIVCIALFLFLSKSKVWLGVIAVLASLVLGYGLSHLNYALLNRNEANCATVTVTGRVCDLGRNGGGNNVVYLENCTDNNGVRYYGRIQTYIFDGDVNVGEILTVCGTLNSVYPVKNKVDGFYLRNKIRYRLDTESILNRTDGRLSPDENVRKYIYDITAEYMPNNGGVLYALLTGDRNALSGDKENAFKSAGIIHTLAVSGLHVGFVTAMFCGVLRRFKLRPVAECAILLVPLVFYAYFCNFTPSVIRAIIMTVCSYLAKAFYGRYDMLNSLSWAVIIILLYAPFNLFDVGFQLSVLSVFGIATLYVAFNRAISKRINSRIFKRLLSSAAVSFSCSVATFFAMQFYFGYAPVVGVLLNIVIIPFVTLAFVLGWFGLIPWIFRYILIAADWILETVSAAAELASGLSFATAAIPVLSLAIAVVAVWLFIAGGYVNLRKVGKIAAHSVCAAALALCVCLSFVKSAPKSQVYVSYGYGSPVCAVTSANGQAAIIGDFSDKTAYMQAAKYLGKYKVTSCVLYLTDCNKTQTELLTDALNFLPINKAYKIDASFSGAVEELLKDYNIPLVTMFPNSTVGEDIKITSVYNGSLAAALVDTDGLTLAVLYGNKNNVLDFLSLDVASHIYVTDTAYKEFGDKGLVTLSRYQLPFAYNYGSNKYGTFTISKKGDKINIKFR